MRLRDFFERHEWRRCFVPLFYLFVLAWLVSVWRQTGFSFHHVNLTSSIVVFVIATFGVLLFVVSILELISYLIFLPIAGRNVQVLSQVHGELLIHPLSASLILITLAVTILTGASWGWKIWGLMFCVFGLQTYLILDSVDSSENGPPDHERMAKPGLVFGLLSLMLGAEVITLSAGAKPLSPWKIGTLPDDTWIVDVRTKAEFQWNRLNAAENYPWGLRLYEAALKRPKDRPVLVMCFSGHRSPSVAVMLRRMGFEQVYNLHWGLLYYILLNRGRDRSGPLGLTRDSHDTSGRGRDYKLISVGYVIAEFLMLILAPIESHIVGRHVPSLQKWVGAILGIGGFLAALMAYRELGRNFRVFAAPRRSGRLITTGIYSKVRHPMYTAVIFAFLGYILYWGSLWGFPLWLIMTTLYVVKTWKEEEVLKERYPAYPDYERNSWRFFPYVF
ncbi:MAG: methyltransferase [Desulfomonilaceae bacterium]